MEEVLFFICEIVNQWNCLLSICENCQFWLWNLLRKKFKLL